MNLDFKARTSERAQPFDAHLLNLRVAGFNTLATLLQLHFINPLQRCHVLPPGRDQAHSRLKLDALGIRLANVAFVAKQLCHRRQHKCQVMHGR